MVIARSFSLWFLIRDPLIGSFFGHFFGFLGVLFVHGFLMWINICFIDFCSSWLQLTRDLAMGIWNKNMIWTWAWLFDVNSGVSKLFSFLLKIWIYEEMAINGFASKLSKTISRFLLAAGGQNKTIENDSVWLVLFCISSRYVRVS